jgi:predicted enzyme related to lactoylglutathione lyase
MHVQFAELPVFDQDPAKAFYVDIFDCRVAADQPMGKDGWRWIELRFASAETALHFLRRRDEAPSTKPVLVFVDDDVEATVERLKSRGVEIVSEPQKAPWQPGRTVAEFGDSEGNRIVIGSR